ncbi:MAG TPA: GyrI-like domain-containing protein [Rhizomicrobium sp.]
MHPRRPHIVFALSYHISSIRMAWTTIWNKWLPASGLELTDSPFFERYGESFDPRTGSGGFEFWLPLKNWR